MSVPQFGGLGKSAKDIFNKDYPLGSFKLDVKTKRPKGVEISSGIATELDTLNSFGALETKYKMEDCGLTVTQKYDTNNTYSAQATFADQLVQGSTLSFSCSYAPEPGTISSHLTGTFANEISAVSGDLDLDLNNPTFVASAVLGCSGWLGGLQAGFDIQKMEITENSFAIGYVADEFAFHSAFSDGTKFTGSFYHRVDPQRELGVQVTSSTDTNETLLGIGCRYKLDSEASLCAKLNTRGQLGFAYQQKLHEGITMCIATQYSISEFSAGGQRLGATLNFDL